MKKGKDNEEEQVFRTGDHLDFSRAGGGLKTAEVCRRHGISQPAFYNWKAKFGGMDVSDAKRLRALEEENAKLKKLLDDAG